MFKRFDDNTLQIINNAKEYTKSHFQVEKIGTESLLYIMFADEKSICRFLLEDYRVTISEIEEVLSSFILIRSHNDEYTEKFKEVMKMAETIADENDSTTVLEEHLLFALLVVRDTVFEEEIKRLNLNSLSLIDDLKDYFNINNEKEFDNYSVNMTRLAKDNKLAPLIGREDYLLRMETILARKNKNNILLVGSAGVGKTALVEGLAKKASEENRNIQIISINVASIVANTKYRGDFEARINKVLADIIETENVIIFIDEIHTIMGAGSADNTLDIANILKPYLARNSFRCIGATTVEEYNRTITKDKALARRFQMIFVNEPNKVETEKILEGIKESFVTFHEVSIENKYLPYIVNLAEEKITNRKFPDKAIDLMDEAMTIAKMNNRNTTNPQDIEDALKNITGIQKGIIENDYYYDEIEDYYIDNFLGIKKSNCLVSIHFNGNESNRSILIEELKKGFGISSEMILEIDFSNYSESYSLSSLLGASPGYVGYDDGGVLSEHFSKYPYQILVIKNYYAGSRETQNLIQSMLDSGHFVDKKGRSLSIEKAVIIFVDEDKEESGFGFIPINSHPMAYDFCMLHLRNKANIIATNPFLDNMRAKGYDLLFDQSEYEQHTNEFKRGFLKLLNAYSYGKYRLFYNSQTNELEIENERN